jgi:membrane protease YdiL (CAAX protease family)
MRSRPLVAFFVLTFAITWGLGGCFALFPAQFEALFGEISNTNPLFFVAVYAPSVSALIVTAYTGGISGLRELLNRLLRWRVGLRWYLTVFLGVPLLLLGSAALSAWFSGKSLEFGPKDWRLALYALLIPLVTDPGPLGEELGWRGFALPRLLERWSALSASLILGLIWGLWHLPAFFFSGLPQSQFSLPAFLVGTVALSVLMTWVFQNTRGSVLLAVLIHWLFNANDIPRGSFPAVAVVLTVAALIVVLVTGPRHLSRSAKGSFAPAGKAMTSKVALASKI